METCKARARRWVHAFSVGGIGLSSIPNPIPGFTTGALIAAETYMAYMVSKIYREPLSPVEAAGLLASLGSVGEGLKIVATQACEYIPVAGWLVKGFIAGSAIEAMGNLVIEFYEKKYPSREYERDPDIEKEPKRSQKDQTGKQSEITTTPDLP